MSRQHTSPRSGFTLLEILTVLIIMGIMAAVAAPSFSDSLMYQRVESAGRRVKLDLELARREAMHKSTSRTLNFTSPTAYEIQNIDGFDQIGATYAVDLAESPYEVGQVSIDFGGLDSVVFNGYGVPSSGGTITLAIGNHVRNIVLDGATGTVSISTP